MDDRVVDPPLPPRAALRWSIVRQIIAEQQPETILELGCGLGSVGARLARMATYTAVEPDPRSYHVARQRITPLGGTVCNGDHRQAPTPGRYDLVCAFEVLEHLADDAAALAEWLPLVRPGGRLLLSVPADPDRFGSWDVLVGHYRRYSAEQLRQRLAEAGATQIRIVHYGWPLGYLLDEVRNRWARGRGSGGGANGTAEERTTRSGRVLQPRGSLVGGIIRMAVSPFAALQRMRPDRGPGLVAVATRPG
jgi:SAM-dependent methyltransferase